MDASVNGDFPPQPGTAAMLARAWLSSFGWRIAGVAPDVPKAVVVAAPHTSNWDLPFTLAVAAALGVRISWMGKHTLFRPPFGALMKALGGLSVDRRSPHGAVGEAIHLLARHERLFLVIAPAGTRTGTDHQWKTGFYRIAQGAGVPIVLGFLDYGRKVAGLGTVFTPTGDMERDIAKIREFYAPMRGKRDL
jgi:1-acyl-sn-glycerol-3-phosphate acyltransferase